MSMIAYILNITNYGSIHKSEFILQFRVVNRESDFETYMEIITKFAKNSTLLHVEPSGDNLSLKMSFDIVMKKDENQNNFITEISAFQGISEVVLIAAKHDVDY